MIMLGHGLLVGGGGGDSYIRGDRGAGLGVSSIVLLGHPWSLLLLPREHRDIPWTPKYLDI